MVNSLVLISFWYILDSSVCGPLVRLCTCSKDSKLVYYWQKSCKILSFFRIDATLNAPSFIATKTPLFLYYLLQVLFSPDKKHFINLYYLTRMAITKRFLLKHSAQTQAGNELFFRL